MSRHRLAPDHRLMAALTATSVAAVTLLVLHGAMDLLPSEPIVATLTVGRLVLITAMVALYLQGARPRDLRTGIDWWVALLLVAATLSAWYSGHGWPGVRGLVEHVGLFYVVVGCLRRDEETRGLPLVAALAVASVGGIAVAQVVQGVPTTFYREGLQSVTSTASRPDLMVRAIGTFPNPNLLSGFMLLLAPLAALATMRTGDREQRTIVAVAVAVGYAGLVVSFSRAGLVGLALSGAAAGVVMLTGSDRWRWYGRHVQLAVAIVVVGLIVAIVSGVAGPIAARDEAWSLGLAAAGQSPLLGVGIGRAGDVMNAIGNPALPYFHAHNLWLNWLVEAGPLAAIAMVAIVGLSLRTAFRRALAGSGLALAGLVSLAGFATASLLDHPANAARIDLLLWFALAFSHAPVRRTTLTRSAEHANHEPTTVRPRHEPSHQSSPADQSLLRLPPGSAARGAAVRRSLRRRARAPSRS